MASFHKCWTCRAGTLGQPSCSLGVSSSVGCLRWLCGRCWHRGTWCLPAHSSFGSDSHRSQCRCILVVTASLRISRNNCSVFPTNTLYTWYNQYYSDSLRNWLDTSIFPFPSHLSSARFPNIAIVSTFPLCMSCLDSLVLPPLFSAFPTAGF